MKFGFVDSVIQTRRICFFPSQIHLVFDIQTVFEEETERKNSYNNNIKLNKRRSVTEAKSH